MSLSTIGLSDYDIGLVVNNKPLRIEIVGACLSEFKYFANVISTCAFNIINSNYSCSPGMIYPNVIKMYEPNIDMKHVMFVPPFLWNDQLKTLHFDNDEIAWLQVIPISENEYVFAEEYGVEELQTKLEKSKIDILDIERDSIL